MSDINLDKRTRNHLVALFLVSECRPFVDDQESLTGRPLSLLAEEIITEAVEIEAGLGSDSVKLLLNNELVLTDSSLGQKASKVRKDSDNRGFGDREYNSVEKLNALKKNHISALSWLNEAIVYMPDHLDWQIDEVTADARARDVFE